MFFSVCVQGDMAKLMVFPSNVSRLQYFCYVSEICPQLFIIYIGYIIHLESEKCFYPAGGKVPGENHPIVLSKCHKPASRFRMYKNGTIQHVLSGLCVHPTGNCSSPEDNTELVFSKFCNGPGRKFVFNLDGY